MKVFCHQELFFHVGSTEQCRSGKNFQFQG